MDNRKQIINLLENKVPKEFLEILYKGAQYYQNNNGVSLNTYWENKEFDNRDEFYIVLNAYFDLRFLIEKLPYKNDWCGKFDSAFFITMKSIAQSALALDKLTKYYCYADSFSICRSMISKLNFLLICALNPNLFEIWFDNPKDERFLEGHIRQELRNNGINTVSHLYELCSEIIHGHPIALNEIGFLNKGLFLNNPRINNDLWVIAKFVVALSYHIIISMTLLDNGAGKIPEQLDLHDKLLSWLKEKILVNNRVDHIFLFFPEERHVEKVGKNKFEIATFYDFNSISTQINKFHRKGQKKTLSKKYNI